MMRPTASSASKTHEKTEVKSPPKRASMLPKSKRKSGSDLGEKEKAKQVNGHTSVLEGPHAPEDQDPVVEGEVAGKESAQAGQEVSVQD